MSFENTEGKGEIARNEQFLLFPLCFLSILENFLPYSSNLKLSSTKSFSLEESKILSFGNEWLKAFLVLVEKTDFTNSTL